MILIEAKGDLAAQIKMIHNINMSEISFRSLVEHLKSKKVYMMIGNGTKNQFRDMRKVKKYLREITKLIPKNSAFLYFGDASNKKNPDVGYLFELLHKMRPDIDIVMIQINKAKSWGVPNFVNKVYWHGDFNKSCTWGGIYKGKPCSNTKKWVTLNKRLPDGISMIFVFGGGMITLDEMKLAKKHSIPVFYIPVERKFLGDKKTRVTKNHSESDRIGVTFVHKK